MSLYEVNLAATIIRETAHPEANLIFGAVIDEEMGDDIRLTVIATGFDDMSRARRQVIRQRRPAEKPESQPQREHQEQVSMEREVVQPRFAPNNLDIPAFLRRR